jgi:hypothetical protein
VTRNEPVGDVVILASRFNGPPGSGNGGYVAGRLARYVQGPASVRLRLPPPLDRPLRVEAGDGEARLFDGDTLVAQAQVAELELSLPVAPTPAEAEAAAAAYAGFLRHPLPRCFVCGTARGHGDGLRIFAGPTKTAGVLAARWLPDASLDDGGGRVATEFLWAALDCPGGFAVMEDADRPVILGELGARIDGTLAIGEPAVVAAWPLGVEGRKRFAGTALWSATGRPIAVARATWIEIAALPAGAA